MTREEILKAALSRICGEREEDYGQPEDNFRMIGNLWQTYLVESGCLPVCSVTIGPHDVAVMMALLKIARIAAGPQGSESWVDLAGYAACGGEIATGG